MRLVGRALALAALCFALAADDPCEVRRRIYSRYY